MFSIRLFKTPVVESERERERERGKDRHIDRQVDKQTDRQRLIFLKKYVNKEGDSVAIEKSCRQMMQLRVGTIPITMLQNKQSCLVRRIESPLPALISNNRSNYRSFDYAAER